MVRLAAEALGAPTAAVSLVDDERQFYKSAFGVSEEAARMREAPLSHSFCQYAVATKTPLVVEDAREHPVLRDNAAVHESDVIAYVGIPLIDPGGHALGTLCVWDSQPRQWTRGHVQILEDLARMTTQRIPHGGPGTPSAEVS
jgi:GAF domain-containing protein